MRWLAVLGLVLLAGCAPRFGARGPDAVPPVMAAGELVTRDGARLPLRRWDAEGAPRAVIVALHGMSDYSNAFAMPGAYWAKHGITTIAYDQRGFGRNANPGLWAGADTMRADLNDAVDAARAAYPGVPVYALGESMGGAVVLTALASAHPPRADGAILVAPAVWSRGDMPLPYRAALFVAAHLMPGMILSNNAGKAIVKIVPSDNVPMMQALGRDPLFQKRTRTDTVYGLVNLMDEARTAPQRLDTAAPQTPPILFLHGEKDQVIPPAPTRAVVAELTARAGSRVDVRRYPNGYHMLLRDLQAALVDQDVVDWIFRNK